MRVNSIRIEGNNPFRSTIQSSVSLKMENGHLCLFPCFTGLVGDGWIAAHRQHVRRRRATGWTGEQQMVSPCGNPLALRLPGSHGGRTGWASGTPEPMACRSKTPRPSESGTPLCHGAGGCAALGGSQIHSGRVRAACPRPGRSPSDTAVLRAPASRTIHRD